MKFKPCIDLHNGMVKQIVGSTLSTSIDVAPTENFVATMPASFYATKYKNDDLKGGHIIMLGPGCETAALEALQSFPNGMQLGGGINIDNAKEYLEAGASHIIVTSYVFKNGSTSYENLDKLRNLVGKEHIVVDLSCRKHPDRPDGPYFVVTDKWTKFTNTEITQENLQILSEYCDEFLVHGVDVEGKMCGIEKELVELLGAYSPIQVTYAGGVRSIEDLELVKLLGKGKVDCTVGSALDIFGGTLAYNDVLAWHYDQQNELQTNR